MNTMTTLVNMLKVGFSFPESDQATDVDTLCALTGERINRGVSLKHVIKDATADIPDTFRYSQHLSTDAAAIFADSKFTGNVFADETGRGLRPFVSVESGTEERPAWSSFVRTLTPGLKTVAIATLNTKRRLWVNAEVSEVGPDWKVYHLDGAIERSLNVDWYALIYELDYLEYLLETTPFSKAALGDTLIGPSTYKYIAELGLRDVLEIERVLASWRNSDTFTFALFIAQNRKKGFAE